MIRRDALNWLKEAQADLKRALKALSDGDYALSAFMAQQACEKAFKAAYLGLAKQLYPRTHDLVVLFAGLKDYLKLPSSVVESLPEVSQYYVTARYPNAGLEVPSESISKMQAARACEVASKVVLTVEEEFKRAEDP